MAISYKNRDTIYHLLKLGQCIQRAYFRIDNRDYSRLLNLLDQESSLIQNFDFSNTSLNDVERIFEEQLSIDIKTDVPYCLSPILTDNTYPYLRLIARLRYEYRKKSKKFTEYIVPYEVDAEIATFYRSLICDSDLYLEYREEMRKTAIYALIESPTIERAIIQNGMEPLEEVFDCLPFQLELLTIYHTKRVTGISQMPIKENLIELKHRRADVLFNKSDEFARQYIDLYKSGQDSQLANFLICVSYFKAVVSLQEPIRRKLFFDSFEKFNIKSLEDERFYDFVAYHKFDIQKLLVPSVTKVSFVYRPLKK